MNIEHIHWPVSWPGLSIAFTYCSQIWNEHNLEKNDLTVPEDQQSCRIGVCKVESKQFLCSSINEKVGSTCQCFTILHATCISLMQLNSIYSSSSCCKWLVLSKNNYLLLCASRLFMHLTTKSCRVRIGNFRTAQTSFCYIVESTFCQHSCSKFISCFNERTKASVHQGTKSLIVILVQFWVKLK